MFNTIGTTPVASWRLSLPEGMGDLSVPGKVGGKVVPLMGGPSILA